MDTFDRFALTVATGLAVWCVMAFILVFTYRDNSVPDRECQRYTPQSQDCYIQDK
jgi:hypothetical protein